MRASLDAVDLERDRSTVARFQAGDRAAFDELYFRYFPLIRRFCERQIRDPHDAEELAQETFVRALRALSRFGGDQRLYPWLTVIARRLCIDHQRKQGRVQVSDELDRSVPSEAEERLDHEVDLVHLRAALARMQERHREVLRLREWDELTYDAIAEQMGVRVGTVQSLLHRARGALRREFLAVAGTLGTVPPIGALWGVLRRTWRRAAQTVERLPDASALAAPMAAASLGVATIIGIAPQPQPVPVTLDAPVVAPAVAASSAPPALLVPDPLPAETPATTPPVAGPALVAPSSDPAPVVEGTPARVYLGEEGIRGAREESSEQPLFVDVANNAFLGTDPLGVQEDMLGKLDNLRGGR